MYADFSENVGRITSYAGKKYKLTNFRSLRNRGANAKKHTAKGQAGNKQKLKNNLSRAKATAYALAICNPWEYFVTLTLDKQKYDRTDLGKFKKDLAQLVRDVRKKYPQNEIKYFLIPERHKDGCWHMHGFFHGLPMEELHEFSLDDHIPHKIRSRITQGKKVYTWARYAKKFGFSDLEQIENHEAASNYMMKYITKEAMNTIKELNAHIFYASQGLKREEIICQEPMEIAVINPDFENDWVTVKWSATVEPLLIYLGYTEEGNSPYESIAILNPMATNSRNVGATVNI